MPARPHAFAPRFPPLGWAALGRDAVAGVAVAAVSPWVASQLVRAAPHAWAFQTRHGSATA